jgi:hypothetical protein
MNSNRLTYLVNRRYGVTHDRVAICVNHFFLMGNLDVVVGNVAPTNDGSLACIHCCRRSVLVNASEADGVLVGYLNGR